MTTLCRDCLKLSTDVQGRRCPHCDSPRLKSHPELAQLSIAHIDCDAFYANVEKRDRSELRDRPVIVGGRHRGVVAAACYVARLYGVHSAMPMFKALKACPEAVVLRPDMAKYRRVGEEIRGMMRDLTPLVEPLSIDEAFLDLTGTEALHGGAAARSLARLALEVERRCGVTVSIGLSYNKFLAKIASDLDKPRGFAVIGRAEAQNFLADKPVGIIWGAGKALQRALAKDGITKVTVEPNAPAKSISAETTFDEDHRDLGTLAAELWPLCEKVSGRLKRAGLAGQSVTLKLKTAEFRLLTRSRRLSDPTRLAEGLYQAALALLEREADGRRFRLIGVGASDLVDGDLADPPSLLDQAIDQVRDRLGDSAIGKGRALIRPKPPPRRQ
jgi:DNA polymerase-4